MIRGDERKGKQSSWTLLSNALKFMPDGGRIDVGARLRDGAAEVSLGQSLADQIMKEVFQPQTALPSPSNSVEWLLAQTFSTTIYVPQLFSETVADRALSELHDRAWSAVLGVASNKTPLAISTFNERAALRYRQYEDAMTVFLVQRNEMPMMNALLENVSRGGSLDQRLDLWMSFNASMRAHKEALTEIQSQFELVS